MDSDRVVIRKVRSGWDVEADGRVASNLCWEEMLGQVATITHPDIKAPRFRTLTPYEEIEQDTERHRPKPELYASGCDRVIDGKRCGLAQCDLNDCDMIPF